MGNFQSPQSAKKMKKRFARLSPNGYETDFATLGIDHSVVFPTPELELLAHPGGNPHQAIG
jgi:hypothetical protein